MVGAELNPAYLIRKYAWEILKVNDPETWDESKYGGMVPIVPLAEEPELSQYSGPHIVYGYAQSATGSLPTRKVGSMTFAIYDQNFRRLTKTINILEYALGRKDDTATDVNKYTSTIPAFHGLAFGTIDIGFIEGGTPEDTEGGNQSALINIRYEFYIQSDIITSLV